MLCYYCVKRNKEYTYFASILKVRYMMECTQKNLKTLVSTQGRPEVH